MCKGGWISGNSPVNVALRATTVCAENRVQDQYTNGSAVGSPVNGVGDLMRSASRTPLPHGCQLHCRLDLL